MNLTAFSAMTRTSFAPSRVGRRSRMSLLVTLFMTALVAACGGDSGSQPEEDGETSEARVLRPGDVRTLAVAGVTSRSVSLRFTQVSDGVNRPASYEVRYRPTPMGNNWRSATVAREGSCAYPVGGTAVGATLTCTVEGLEPGRSYDFQIMPFRPFGSITINGRLSNIVTGRTSADTGGPASMAPVSGAGQIGQVGEPLPQDLVVRVKDSQGAPLANVTVNWSVSGGGGSVSAATSRTDSNGDARISRILGIVIGQNRTTAFVTGLTPVEFGSDAVAGPPASVTVLPSEVTLGMGETADMQARLADRYGNPVYGADISWSSSDPNVAAIDASGRVAARGAGTAGVTASAETAAGVISASTMTAASPTAKALASGVTATSGAPAAAAEGSSTVRVTDGSANYPAEVVRTGGNSQTGVVGQALDQPFTVTVRNAAGAPLGNVQVTWEITAGGGTLAESVSTSSDDGRAQTRLTLGTTAGSNAVRATVEGLDPVSFSATATPGSVASISVTPTNGTVGVGSTLQFTATPRDQYGNAISTGTPSWSSSSTGVATVSGSGLASGVSAGSAQIRATMNGFTGSGTLSVTATSGPTTNPATVDNLSVQSTTTSSVTLRFTSVNDGTGNPARYQVRYAATPLGWGWGTATPVASGTCAGVVQGGAIGTTVTCTVTGLDAGNSYDFQLVSYRGDMEVFGNLSNIATGVTGASAPTQGTLAISPRGGTLTSIGATLQLSVTARNSGGSVISSPGATWTSSNASVATVDASGRVTARGLGTAIISVAASCCTIDQVSVSVTQQISSVSVSPGSVSINQGSGAQLTAVARDANGNTVPGVTFTWSSSNAWVAPVNSSGWVTGSNAGNAGISVSAGGRTASATVTVAAVNTGGGTGGSTGGGTGGSGGGSMTSYSFTNEPAGMTERTHARWVGSTPSGWNMRTGHAGAAVRIISDPTSPTGGAMEHFYPRGLGDGLQPGVAWYSGNISGAQELFMGTVMKYSSNWTAHQNQIKLHLINVGAAGWMGMFDGCWQGRPGVWSMAVWGGSTISYPSKTGDCWNNNVRPVSPTYTPGTWVKQEMYIRKSTSGQANGIIRIWIDGALVLDATGLSFPSNLTFGEFQHAGTWGGGGGSVPQDQSLYIAATYISTR